MIIKESSAKLFNFSELSWRDFMIQPDVQFLFANIKRLRFDCEDASIKVIAQAIDHIENINNQMIESIELVKMKEMNNDIELLAKHRVQTLNLSKKWLTLGVFHKMNGNLNNVT
jgi:hypothetical protein